MSRTAVFLAAFDSQLKWCAAIRDELAARGFAWRVLVPDVRSALSPAQVAAAGFLAVEPMTWPEMVATAAASDVVVSGLSGPLTARLMFDLAERDGVAGPSPVVVTGWVGVIIEKVTAGYLDRCGSDVVAVNAHTDLAHFRGVAERLGLDDGNLLLTGLPILSRTPRPPREGPIRRVLFADQPTVPRHPEERRYVYSQLIAYAEAHPDRQVVLKPRHRPGEDTFHRMRHHPEVLLAGPPRPANLTVDYTSVADQLATTDLVLTVSSTAFLEAIDAGCRVALVLDLGIHERHGNHVFLDSGLLRTFAQITADDLGTPDPVWQASYFFPRAGGAAEVLADRVEALLASGHRPSRAVRESAYFRSAAAFAQAIAASREVRSRPRAPLSFRRRAGRLGRAVLPPVLVKPVRRVAAQVGVLR